MKADCKAAGGACMKSPGIWRPALMLCATLIMSLAHCSEAPDQAAIERGREIFVTYCVLCHGPQGRGDGRLAVNKMPPPANLRRSILSDDQKREIIVRGGDAVGRSGFMPPWGQELDADQIENLIAYLTTIRDELE